MKEKWKDIPGYENLYQASDLGRIRTHPQKITSSKRFPVRHWACKILKGRGSNPITGFRVNLWKDGKYKEWLVCRLVALTWVSGYQEGLTVDHVNGNRFDNRAENLEWVTLSENIQRGFETGLYNSIQKKTVLTSNGVSYEFSSMSKASQFLGHTSGYIHNCLKKGTKPRSASGQTFEVVVSHAPH